MSFFYNYYSFNFERCKCTVTGVTRIWPSIIISSSTKSLFSSNTYKLLNFCTYIYLKECTESKNTLIILENGVVFVLLVIIHRNGCYKKL